MADRRYQVYFDFLDQIGGILDQLTAISKEKTAAVRKDDLLAVDECMKREQVISLKLRSMDAKRDKMIAELGLTGTNLSTLAAKCPEEVRGEAKAVAARVRSKYEIYRAASEVARTTLECNLHQIDKLLAGAEETTPRRHEGFADIRA